MARSIRRIRTPVLVAVLVLLSAYGAWAADSPEPESLGSGGPLRVGVWEAPPFVIDEGDGRWGGFAYELWEDVAEAVGVQYEVIPFSHHELLEALADRRIHIGISDIAITRHRGENLDFSRPFFHSELSVASRIKSDSSVDRVLGTVFSSPVLIVIGVLFGLVLFGALIFWAIEKHDNDMLYNPDHKRWNFANGIMWAILLITAQEPDIFKNRSVVGRLVAMGLLFIGVTVSASYIALITSSVTVSELTTEVQGADDLPFIRVGSLSDSRATEYLSEHHINHAEYETLDKAMRALVAERIDAVVADEVELIYYIRRHTDDPVSLLPVHLETEYYAFAFPQDSDLRPVFDPAISEVVEHPGWRAVVERYLGSSKGSR